MFKRVFKQVIGPVVLFAMCSIMLSTLTCTDVYADKPDNRPPDNRPPEEPAPVIQPSILIDDDDDLIVVPGSTSSASGCDTAGAAIGVKAGGFSMSFPTYPCSIKRTYEAIEHTLEVDENGKALHGWWTGKLPRFFLRARLVTKGVFSAIFGLIGLG